MPEAEAPAPRAPGAARHLSIGALYDVPIPVSLRLGEQALPLSGVLEFGTGSPMVLDLPSDQSVELVAAGKVVARGRLVIIEGCYGIEVVSVP